MPVAGSRFPVRQCTAELKMEKSSRLPANYCRLPAASRKPATGNRQPAMDNCQLMNQDYPAGILQVLVADVCGIEMDGAERRLHDRPEPKGADQRPDADRPAQQPADQGGGAQEQDAHGTDGQPFGPLRQPDQQGVPRPAAEGGHHVGPLGIGQNHHPEQHHRDRRQQGAGGFDGVEPVEEVHRFADDDGVNEHGEADGLAHQDVDEQDRDGYGDGGRAVEDPQGFGDADVQHVPGGSADIGLDRQVDAEAVHKKADRGQQHIQDDRFEGSILP